MRAGRETCLAAFNSNAADSAEQAGHEAAAKRCRGRRLHGDKALAERRGVCEGIGGRVFARDPRLDGQRCEGGLGGCGGGRRRGGGGLLGPENGDEIGIDVDRTGDEPAAGGEAVVG